MIKLTKILIINAIKRSYKMSSPISNKNTHPHQTAHSQNTGCFAGFPNLWQLFRRKMSEFIVFVKNHLPSACCQNASNRHRDVTEIAAPQSTVAKIHELRPHHHARKHRSPHWAEKHIYRNNLKNREFDQEAPQNFCLERATIAGRQGASEDKNSGAKPTQSKTDSSSCFGISNPRHSAATQELNQTIVVLEQNKGLRLALGEHYTSFTDAVKNFYKKPTWQNLLNVKAMKRKAFTEIDKAFSREKYSGKPSLSPFERKLSAAIATEAFILDCVKACQRFYEQRPQ